MAHAKKVASSASSTSAATQREGLFFATDLYHYVLNRDEITKYLPPRFPGVSESHFTENIGKAVIIFWITYKENIRGIGPYHMKILTSAKMKEHLHEAFERTCEKERNAFQGVLFMSAFLMDTHLFLFQRSCEGSLSRLPALWTELFQKHYSRRFVTKGGWDRFKTYVVDWARKCDNWTKAESLPGIYAYYVVTHTDIKLSDRTKEMRMFIVRKTLESLQKAREKSMDAERGKSASADAKRLCELVEKIASLSDSIDRGIEDHMITSKKMSVYVNQFCHQFYDKDEYRRFLSHVEHPESESESLPTMTDLTYEEKGAARATTSRTPEKEAELSERWDDVETAIRGLLKSVLPADTADEPIDRMADDDYVKSIIRKISEMRITETSEEQADKLEEELNKIDVYLPGRPRRQLDKEKLLKERIEQLEQVKHSEEQSKTPPKESSLPKRAIPTPETPSGDRSRSEASESPEAVPSTSEPQASTSKDSSSKVKPRRPYTRSRKGSKR